MEGLTIAEYASPKDFLISFLPVESYSFHLEIFNTLRFTHARRLSPCRVPGDPATEDTSFALHRAVAYGLLDHYYGKQRSWEEYFSGICPLEFQDDPILSKFTDLDDLIQGTGED
jgi:hypothetical protein